MSTIAALDALEKRKIPPTETLNDSSVYTFTVLGCHAAHIGS
jgi:hypothetical protein